MAEKDRLLDYYYREKDFSPCQHCANVFSEACLKSCTPQMQYKHFELRPGTTLKDLGAFPVKDFMSFPDPYFRMVVMAIYMSAITDYLTHEEEYKFGQEAPNMEKKVPDGYKFEERRHNGRDSHT